VRERERETEREGESERERERERETDRESGKGERGGFSVPVMNWMITRKHETLEEAV
jgi:hypothetical protein